MKHFFLILFGISGIVITPFSKVRSQIIPSPYSIPSDDPSAVLYSDVSIPRIDIFLDPVQFNNLINSPNNETEYPATFVYANDLFTDTVTNIGFGLRGNTSINADKKSFKISFNSYIPGAKYRNLEKMNLNGEHNDPSIIRSKLYWDLAQQLGIPAPRANHVRLYVNNQYRGLYINVEHIDEQFAQNRFGNNNGNLYKCNYPASLEYLGSNADAYKVEVFGRRIYELKINDEEDDYSDLAQFMNALHSSTFDEDFPGRLDEKFNVDNFLRVLALDIFTGNWDGYSYNINNFYLYRNTETGKFEYLPYDTDNTFGIDWFGIDWAIRPVYNWTPESDYPPLTTRVLNIPEFRKRFSYYFNMLLQTSANPGIIFPRIDDLHTLITDAAEEDAFRTMDYGYTIAQFHNSYEQAIGNHVTYGIKPYITARRASALVQLLPQNIAPVIISPKHTPLMPVSGQNIYFTASVFDDNIGVLPDVYFHYRINGSSFTTVPMSDNGTLGDVLANDGNYGAVLNGLTAPATIDYYFTATDVLGASNREPLLESAYRQVTMAESPVPLVVNEFMASNSTIADEFGEFEDWIEIYNAGFESINLSDYFLTDKLNNPLKWRMPDTIIGPQGFMLIWADEDGVQGPHHANFKLGAGGEAIGIFTETGQAVYTLTFGPQVSNLTQGLLPDGLGEVQNLNYPTPGYSNMTPLNTGLFVEEPFVKVTNIYPNPLSDLVFLELKTNETVELDQILFRYDGSMVCEQRSKIIPEGAYSIQMDVPPFLPAGVYFLQVNSRVVNSSNPNSRQQSNTFTLVKY